MTNNLSEPATIRIVGDTSKVKSTWTYANGLPVERDGDDFIISPAKLSTKPGYEVRVIKGEWNGKPYHFEVGNCTPGSWVGINETGRLVEKIDGVLGGGAPALQKLYVIDLLSGQDL